MVEALMIAGFSLTLTAFVAWFFEGGWLDD